MSDHLFSVQCCLFQNQISQYNELANNESLMLEADGYDHLFWHLLIFIRLLIVSPNTVV